MLEQLLQKLGFGKNDISVYLALYALGKCRAGEIIKHTGLHRNLVYTSLSELEKKELVSKVLVGSIAKFEANNPESVIRMIEDQKKIAEDAVLELKKIQTVESKDIKVHEGYEGMTKARERMLESPAGTTMYVFASSASSRPEFEKYWRDFHNRREDKKIKLKILYQRTDDPFIKASVTWRKSLPLAEAKYFPNNINAPLWMSVCGDMLDIGIMSAEPITLSMNNAEAAEGFKQYFNSFWEQPVAVESGLNALRRTFYEMLDELVKGEEYYVFGASTKDSDKSIHDFYSEFHDARIKKGVVVKMLAYKNSFDTIKKRFSQSGDPFYKISHLKILQSAPVIPMQINVFKNKTFFIIYSNPITILHFDHPDVSEGFRVYFDELWKVSN
ncbi:MAG TPA: helix-turn-helix domain-containing protein [Candidatus Magasanikbacteria bacterium]|nr:helix-turn-helix domain-containing protein [Candidatus Magasanikbacteria bacterium]